MNHYLLCRSVCLSHNNQFVFDVSVNLPTIKVVCPHLPSILNSFAYAGFWFFTIVGHDSYHGKLVKEMIVCR